jgi:hypothetical protein
MDKKENAQKWYQKLEFLFQELPDFDDPIWDADQRDRWLTALEGIIGLYIDVEHDPDEYHFDEELPF